MATVVAAKSLLFSFLLVLHTVYSSGTLVGFLYDAREESPASWSPTEMLSLLQRNRVSPSQFKVLVTNPVAFFASLSDTAVSVDLFVNRFQARKLQKSKASANSWLKNHLVNTLPHLNIGSIVVSGSEQTVTSLLSTIKSIQTSLATFNLDRSVKVPAMFSLSHLESLTRTHDKNFRRLMEVIKNSQSFIVIEAFVDGELSLGDGFVNVTIQRAISVCSVLPYPDIPIVLNVKSPVVPSGTELAEFPQKMIKSMDSYDLIRGRVIGLFTEILHVKAAEQEKLSWEEELIFPSSHRELLKDDEKHISAAEAVMHDVFNPVTNPATTPITVPSTNPAPAVVTVPATNPITVLPTNPTMSPFTVPPPNPVTTPITVPATDPMPTPTPTPTPVTSPVVPVTNPATTPSTLPVSPSVTNPGTPYTFPPPAGSTPSVTPPVTVPSTVPNTVPVSPAVSGQTWCVARTGIPDASLQLALDYACGIGGADCSAIQQTGSCYNPNSLQAHASYAFNSYYQRHLMPTSCDFGGTAMLVNVNPSSASCIYPTSSSMPSYNPAATGTLPGYTPGSSSGSSVFNTNNSGGPNTVFGTDNPSSTPAGSMSNSSSLSAGWSFLFFMVTMIYVTTGIK